MSFVLVVINLELTHLGSEASNYSSSDFSRNQVLDNIRLSPSMAWDDPWLNSLEKMINCPDMIYLDVVPKLLKVGSLR